MSSNPANLGTPEEEALDQAAPETDSAFLDLIGSLFAMRHRPHHAPTKHSPLPLDKRVIAPGVSVETSSPEMYAPPMPARSDRKQWQVFYAALSAAQPRARVNAPVAPLYWCIYSVAVGVAGDGAYVSPIDTPIGGVPAPAAGSVISDQPTWVPAGIPVIIPGRGNLLQLLNANANAITFCIVAFSNFQPPRWA